MDKSKLSSEDIKVQRELFWYREELFKTVRGRWKEVRQHRWFPSHVTQPKKTGGSRSGDLFLRQQRLTRPMLRALRMYPIHIQMELSQQDDDEDGVSQKIVNRRGSKYRAPPNEFLFLRMRIKNVSCKFRTGFRVVHDV